MAKFKTGDMVRTTFHGEAVFVVTRVSNSLIQPTYVLKEVGFQHSTEVDEDNVIPDWQEWEREGI